MVRFDIGGIPSGATIQSASLELTVFDESSGSFEIYRVSKAWVPTQATWNRASSASVWTTPGGDHSATPESSWVATGAPNFVKGSVMKFDMTETVRDWYAHATTNYGWIVRTRIARANENSEGMRFYATNWANMQNVRPKLVINYSTGGTALDARIANPAANAGWALSGSRQMSVPFGAFGNVAITNLAGVRVLDRRVDCGTVDISGLTRGVYQARVSGGAGAYTFCVK